MPSPFCEDIVMAVDVDGCCGYKFGVSLLVSVIIGLSCARVKAKVRIDKWIASAQVPRLRVRRQPSPKLTKVWTRMASHSHNKE
jgi:hypothetical protein